MERKYRKLSNDGLFALATNGANGDAVPNVIHQWLSTEASKEQITTAVSKFIYGLSVAPKIHHSLGTGKDAICTYTYTDTNGLQFVSAPFDNDGTASCVVATCDVSDDTPIWNFEIKTLRQAGYVSWDDVTGKPTSFPPSSHTHTTSDITNFPSIPTKVSELENDENFVTESELPSIPTKVSQLENDENFVTESELPSVPTKTSDLTNDSGFITDDDIPSIPTKVSDLTNDSGFITEDDVPQATFVATYNSTPFADIQQAIAEGKCVKCDVSGYTYELVQSLSTKITFALTNNVNGTIAQETIWVTSDDEWDGESVNLAKTSDVPTAYVAGTDIVISNNTISINTDGSATGTHSFVEGESTEAKGDYSHAEGCETQAIEDASHAEGYGTQAIGYVSHAEGSYTEAIGQHSHAEGHQTQAIGYVSHAEGKDTQADGSYSHAEGYRTQAKGTYSHAEGKDTQAKGTYSHAEGCETQAIGEYSHAEGCETQAKGEYSHVEGCYSTATGSKSHAEGYSDAFGKCSHAEGASWTGYFEEDQPEGWTDEDSYAAHSENYGQAVGKGSHAENYGSAFGYESHAEGEETHANGDYSHVEGYFNTANGLFQHVSGCYAITYPEQPMEDGDEIHEDDLLEIVGCGTSDTSRDNARTLDFAGNEKLKGGLSVYGNQPVPSISTNPTLLESAPARIGIIVISNSIAYISVGTSETNDWKQITM